MIKDDIILASDSDEIIMTQLNKKDIKKNGITRGRIELKIKVTPYQKRDLFYVKMLSKKYQYSYKCQTKNTTKKENKEYLKLRYVFLVLIG